MSELVKVGFLFKDKKFEVQMELDDYYNLPIDIVRDLGRNKPFPIPDNINDDIFQSFISYFENHVQPNITIENIDQYESLNNIMKVPAITELILSKHDLFNNCLQNINILINSSFDDKSNVEIKRH